MNRLSKILLSHGMPRSQLDYLSKHVSAHLLSAVDSLSMTKCWLSCWVDLMCLCDCWLTGLDVEGLFRRSATASVLVQVQQEFNRGMTLFCLVFAMLLFWIIRGLYKCCNYTWLHKISLFYAYMWSYLTVAYPRLTRFLGKCVPFLSLSYLNITYKLLFGAELTYVYACECVKCELMLPSVSWCCWFGDSKDIFSTAMPFLAIYTSSSLWTQSDLQ